MKFTSLILATLIPTLIHAQTLPTSKTEKPEVPVGTIAEPTPEQKQSAKEIKTKAVKAKKNTTEKLDEIDPNDIESMPEAQTDNNIAKPTAQKKKIQKKEEPKKENLFGLHADLNVPHIINYGLDYWHSSRWFSVSLNMGGYTENNLGKYNKDAEGGKLKITNQEAVARIHPFQGAFYLGLTYGQHKIEGSITRTMTSTVPAGSATGDVNVEVSANYLTPHIGWMIVWDFGLSMGFDLGYLSPSQVKTNYSDRIYNLSGGITEDDIRNTDDYKKARSDMEKNITDIGNTSIPYLALFRIGWMF